MKHALVTGGTGVIGAAICRELARAGNHVFVHAHLRVELAGPQSARRKAETAVRCQRHCRCSGDRRGVAGCSRTRRSRSGQ
jgi:NAD(P)-dependent dehydrogenase (short-subunit alcohol dehydrogenase family)